MERSSDIEVDRWRGIACELAGALWYTSGRLLEEHGIDPKEHLPSVYVRFEKMLEQDRVNDGDDA